MKCSLVESVSDWHPCKHGAKTIVPSIGKRALWIHIVLVTNGAHLSKKFTAKIFHGLNDRVRTPKRRLQTW